ncbi:hypothetical protein MUN82_06445 [Hymenobacter aerilatus]|uniref:Uncharacterized protein n=1 Tax=Hymenobacter aerilatus TaxID=2932251 RepID=A0A8T9T0M3_9BACT|nr:hypothetical protein [Hymenobacter aerilatus]UOR06734.1 hypothetical protein MUN82_06445 [Hymenobacter aerilatus]
MGATANTNKEVKKEEVTLTPEQVIENLKAQLAAKDAQIAEQETVISDQTEALKAAEAQGAGALPVISHEGKRYKVVARKFNVDGDTVEATTLKTNKELVAKLIEKGSGILKEIEAK